MPFELCNYNKIWNEFNVLYNIFKVLGYLKGIKGFLWVIYVGTQRLMVSFANNVYILLEFVEIAEVELHFCKVVYYTDIFFKQLVEGEEKQKGQETRVGISWNSFLINNRKIWLDSHYSHKYFIFITSLNFLSMDKSNIPSSASSLRGGNGLNTS